MVETMLLNGYPETKKVEMQEQAKHNARRMLSSKYILHYGKSIIAFGFV